MSKDEFLYKILILGDTNVGKTGFLTRYIDNYFKEVILSASTMDYKLKSVQMEDGSTVKLQIWDTAGRERFRSVTKSFYKGAHGMILIFSVNDIKSFDNIRSWISSLKEEINEKVPIILVGNKIDCKDRTIDKSEGEELANEFNIKYYECSAKTGENINLVFDELTKEMVKSFDKYKDKKLKLKRKIINNKKRNSCK